MYCLLTALINPTAVEFHLNYDIPQLEARPDMPKQTRSFFLVLVITGFVPGAALNAANVWGQAAPSAAAESKATGAKPAETKGTDSKVASKATPAASKASAEKSPSSEKMAAEAAGGENKSNKALTLAENAPNTYTVVKGDTLWDISGKFLKEPWRWPEIWNLNREQIKDPHWIYPGDVINLTFDANGNPRLSIGNSGAGGGENGTVRLSPGVRVDKLAQAIYSIPARAITPFLSLPLVVEEDALINAPKVIASDDNRVIVGAGDKIYAVAVKPAQGTRYQVYRQGKTLIDPTTKEILGYEVNYLGEAKVSKFGESTTLEVVRSTQEINRGDRLTPTTEMTVPSYVPHAPDAGVKGTVISVLGGVSESAQYSVVVVNLGKRNGLEIGHVLAGMRAGPVVSTKTDEFRWSSLIPSFVHQSKIEPIPATVKLSDERNGLLFVFRVFDKVSYALVMSSNRPLKVGDVVQTP